MKALPIIAAIGLLTLAGCSSICKIIPLPVICDTKACVGDCNGDGEVTADEVVLATAINLGSQDISKCKAADENGDGKVSASELTKSNQNAQNGCPK